MRQSAKGKLLAVSALEGRYTCGGKSFSAKSLVHSRRVNYASLGEFLAVTEPPI